MLYRQEENIELIDIEAPEFIASSMHLLISQNWEIKNYNYENLIAEKNSELNGTSIFKIDINDKNAKVECISNSSTEIATNELHSFIISYNDFLNSPIFDEKVTEMKYQYFMNNPIEFDQYEEVKNKTSPKKKIFGFYNGHKVTSTLILLNFIVFALMAVTGVSIMMPETAEIIKWGGNFRPLILEGEWWRLITCAFIHIGIIHILFNMWALFNIGVVIEPMIGSFRFAFAYTISALVASLNSIVWHYATPSAGASGAIFGMFGLFAALLTTNLLEKRFRSAMLKSVMPMIVINLLLGTSAMIDNAGHIGGLLSGAACGYLFAWHYKFPKNKFINLLSFVFPVLFLAVSTFVISKNLPNVYKQYQDFLKNINNYEIKALELSENTQDAEKMKKAGEYWDKAIKDSKKILELKLDKENTELSERLMFYLELRKKQHSILKEQENQMLFEQTTKSIDSVLKIINSK